MRYLLALICSLFLAAVARAERPNVLIILADDLGWMDLSIQGSTFYETPHIDELMRRGMRFDNAYSASPLCSPTRASILTGLHPARIGLTAPRGHHQPVVLEQNLMSGRPELRWLEADTVTRLNTRYLTLAEVFQEQGYRTGHFGKWHLGRDPYSPLAHGYDVDKPHWYGSGPRPSFLAPWDFRGVGNMGAGDPGEHIDDRMADEVIDFIEPSDEPWFVSYWAFSVHSPWDQTRDVKPELLEKFKEWVDEEAHQRSPVMGGMIAAFDDTVGRIMARLDETGQADNTIIVFLSDNGGVHWEPPAKHGYDDRPVTSNAPLRGGKATIYEGGTRVPMAVVYPPKIPANRVSSVLTGSIDVFPTVANLAGVTPSEPIAFDGHDISPVLLGEPVPEALADRTIFVHFPHGRGLRPGYQPSSSLRDGDLKIIRFYADLPDGGDRFELYDLAEDLGETRDLSGENPDLYAAMKVKLDAKLTETDAIIPTANPGYKGPLKGTPVIATFGGWETRKHLIGELRGGRLILECVGHDPYMIAGNVPPIVGEHTLELRLKATAGGEGEIYLATEQRPDFNRDARVVFDFGVSQKIDVARVTIRPEAPLTALRIDPINETGTVEIDYVRLLDVDGKLVKSWNFSE
jgi:arylsulfatase A-like enzyme